MVDTSCTVFPLYRGWCREVEFNAAELEVGKKGRREIKT